MPSNHLWDEHARQREQVRGGAMRWCVSFLGRAIVTKQQKPGGFKQQKFTLIVLEARHPKIKVLAGSCSLQML